MGTVEEDLQLQLPNAIILGPTGVGKTYSMSVASASLGLPFVSIDSTSLVPSGIVGLQVEDIAIELWKAAEEILTARSFSSEPADIRELAQHGVVFLDEFDKIATSQETESSEDVSRRLTQRRLLKFVDGDMVRVGVPSRSYSGPTPQDEFLNTGEIFMIAGGAFYGIEKVKQNRKNSLLYRRMFGSDPYVTEDIRNYGIMPELAARFPILIEFQQLHTTDLVKILATSSRSPLRIWKEYASQSGIELSVAEDALEFFAEKAATLGSGARGLHELIFPFFQNRLTEALTNGEIRVHIKASDLGAKRYAGYGS
jgi:ATP-dependent Clp protease ATP-binding subunit ClpX